MSIGTDACRRSRPSRSARRARFDSKTTFENRRVDVTTSLNFGALTGSVQFANYSRRSRSSVTTCAVEGLALSAKYKFAENYFTLKAMSPST